MQRKELITLLKENPIVAAVNSPAALPLVLSSDNKIVFVLYGTIVDLPTIIARIDACSKVPIVHVDLIEGLSSKEIAVDFIKKNTLAKGIISTNSSIIRRAKELDMLAIQRYFIVDSLALKNVSKRLHSDGADAIELLPGIIPSVIRKLSRETTIPLIAGGLITSDSEARTALAAGALGVSTSCMDILKK